MFFLLLLPSLTSGRPYESKHSYTGPESRVNKSGYVEIHNDTSMKRLHQL